MSTDNLELLTIQEVAAILRLQPTFVMEHVTKKQPLIPSIRINRRVRRFRREDLAAWIESMRDQNTLETAEAATKRAK